MRTKISLSARIGAEPTQAKVSDTDVKTAKNILKTAARQQTTESKDSYKQAVKDIADLRKSKDREVTRLSKEIDKLKAQLDKTSSSYNLKISRLLAVRDKAGVRAGVIVIPKAIERPKAVPKKQVESKPTKRPSKGDKPAEKSKK